MFKQHLFKRIALPKIELHRKLVTQGCKLQYSPKFYNNDLFNDSATFGNFSEF